MTDTDLEAEAHAIFAGAGVERAVVRRDGRGWTLAGTLGGNAFAGCTWGRNDFPADDPRPLARFFVSGAADAVADAPDTGDLGAEMRAWEDEAEQSDGVETLWPEDAEALGAGPGEAAGLRGDQPEREAAAEDAGADVSGPAYPGIAIEQLSDELSVRRAQVIDLITAAEEMRLDGLEDRLKASDQAMKDYNNGDLSNATFLAAQEWMRLSGLANRIKGHAANLRRSARDASLEILRAMAERVMRPEEWPSG